MNKFLQFTAFAALSLMGLQASAADVPKIAGYMLSANAYPIWPAGFYSFTVDDQNRIVSKAEYTPDSGDGNGYLFNSGGSFYKDGYFYIVNTDEGRLLKYDPKTWRVAGRVLVDVDVLANQMTYDPSTNTVYACFVKDPGVNARYFFGTFDPETGNMNQMRELTTALTSMAVGRDGNLYAIGPDGTFYGVIKETGALKRLGSTGLDATEKLKSPMVCDYRTGKLYVARTYAWNYSAFYELDPATGQATLISEFPKSEWYYNLFIDQNVKSLDAPALLTDLSATYEAADNNIAVSFTLPEKTVKGDALSGAVSYSVTVGNSAAFSGSDAPGTAVSRKVSTMASGDVTVSVKLTSAAGAESTSCVETFAGYDTPKGVGDLRVEAGANENAVKVSWTAPTEGVNEGYIEPEAFTYTVVRYPDGTTVSSNQTGTEFTEEVSTTEPKAVSYGVVVNHHGKQSEEAVTAKIVVGPALGVPYAEDFDDESGFDRFTVEDTNNDGVIWQRYAGEGVSYMNIGTFEDNDKDDWAILPKIHLEPGNIYNLTFTASAFYKSRPERMEVKYGKLPTSAAMTEQIMEPQLLKSIQSFDWHPYSYKFEVAEAGDYYIGFHAMSDADKFRIGVDDIQLHGSNVNAPAVVTDNVATPAPLGAKNFTLEFVAPTTTESGSELTDIDRAEVYMNGSDTPAAVVTDIAPGKKVKVEISGTEDGLNDYEIVTANASGKSLSVFGQVYTGLDTPAAPKNIRVTVKDGAPCITWDVPEGLHGGYVDPENIFYVYGRFVNGGEQELLGNTANQPIAIDTDAAERFQEMKSIVYLVAAYNDAGTGATGISEPIYFGGTPYDMPMFESFESGFGDYKCSMHSLSGLGGWYLWGQGVEPTPYDNDYGSIYYRPDLAGDSGRVLWGNVAVKGSLNPTIEFMYYNDPTQTGELGVQINPASQGWKEVERIKMDPSKPAGWQKASISVADVRDEEYVNIGFVAYTHELADIHIDAICLRDLADDNLAIESIDCRRRLDVEKEATFTANVKNLGKNNAEAFRVDLFCEGDLIGSADGKALAAGDTQKVAIKVTPDMSWPVKGMYKAVVVYEKDQLEVDNASPEYEITIVMNKYPVTELQGTADDNGAVELTWAAPNYRKAAVPTYVSDDFESYEPWLISDVGEWTIIDRDRGAGIPLIGFHFPHYLDARGFQVFSLERGFGIEFGSTDTTWVPHSGKTTMVSMYNANGAMDDWLISPELSGEEQTVVFYAKSATFQYGLDEFDFMISSTGNTVKDFRVIDSSEVEANWTEFKFDLPAGTKYFAIRSVGESYALLIDDVMYKPATGVPTDLELIGYNVYSENELLTPKPITETKFTTSLDGKESRRFTMSAVYNYGESARSNRITLTPGSSSGVDEVIGSASGVTIRAYNNHIFVEGAESGVINVYSPSGVLYQSVPATGYNAIPAPQGVWIVKVGNTTAKVMIK